MLKDQGQFYLRDVILQEDNALNNIQNLIDHQNQMGGDFLREDADGHFRDENSTYDWVIDELLHRAGLSILERLYERGVIGEYFCRKTPKR
jgi:hypothetical protein